MQFGLSECNRVKSLKGKPNSTNPDEMAHYELYIVQYNIIWIYTVPKAFIFGLPGVER